MRVYLLIGGIGSGKSTVREAFAKRGVACFDADEVGHQVLDQPDVRESLVQAFGSEILGDDGSVNRASLAQAAFCDEGSTQLLEAVVHPAIVESLQRTLAYLDGAGLPLVVIEVSAYKGPDSALQPLFDDAAGVIAVMADAETRVGRACAKGFAVDDVRNRMKHQASDDQLVAWADFIIDNSASPDSLDAKVQEVWEAISQQEEELCLRI